jgi:hypothetical protein
MGVLAGDPVSALKYGAADFLFSYPATLAVRGLRPKAKRQMKDMATGEIITDNPRSKLEIPANIGASVLSGMAVSSLETTIYSTPGPGPATTTDCTTKCTTRFNQQGDACWRSTQLLFPWNHASSTRS